jgi:hypothetical protein
MMNQEEPDVDWDAIPGYHDVSEILQQKTSAGCTMVRSMTVKNFSDDGSYRCDILLELVHEYSDPHSVQLHFEKCHQLRLDDTYQICGLAFRDVSKRGWESTRFEVFDYEESKISFFCNRITLKKNTEQVADGNPH